ncbi:MAG: elongation factor Ts [Eubacterium sp.]|nr:elongation factor Ts [Eubacterium sp.]
MAFTAQDVKALREKTGVGMMECKKALTEADGDMEKAIDFLRERGLAAAQKKAARIAAEGVVLSYADADAKKGVVIEVNSETDFVAKNEKFVNFVTDCAKTVIATGAATVEELTAAEYMGTGRTVTETLNDLILAIGENMKIRRFETMDGVVATYVHGGGSVGVMVGFDVADEAKAADPAFDEMGKNVAMQIAAMNPAYLDPASVPAEVIEHEKGILAAQMKEDPKMASKPEAVLIKIAEGKMGKYYKESCLVEQEFVRSDLFQGSVKGYIDSVAKALGTEIKANGFIRMTRGEGIEKRQENFAEEIAKQING